MDIKEAILKEHSRVNALNIARFACSNVKHFKTLMECYKSSDYRLSQRAAWSVSWAAKANPEMIKPYIGDLVKMLSAGDKHPAIIRNAVKILQEIEIPKRFHGKVMQACFNFIEDPVTPAAIKAFSLTTLSNLSKTYPEIKAELKLIIEERWDQETAAFKSRGKKVLKAIDSKKEY